MVLAILEEASAWVALNFGQSDRMYPNRLVVEETDTVTLLILKALMLDLESENNVVLKEHFTTALEHVRQPGYVHIYPRRLNSSVVIQPYVEGGRGLIIPYLQLEGSGLFQLLCNRAERGMKSEWNETDQKDRYITLSPDSASWKAFIQ